MAGKTTISIMTINPNSIWIWVLTKIDSSFALFLDSSGPSKPNAFLQCTLVLSLLFGFLAPAHSIDFYDAEIIIFRQQSDWGEDEELDIPNERHLDLQLELNKQLTNNALVYLEPAIDGYLTKSREQLRDNKHYEILFHGRWTQTTANRNASPHVLIHLPPVNKSLGLTGVLHLFSSDLLYIDILLRYQPGARLEASNSQIQTKDSTGPYYFIKERKIYCYY